MERVPIYIYIYIYIVAAAATAATLTGRPIYWRYRMHGDAWRLRSAHDGLASIVTFDFLDLMTAALRTVTVASAIKEVDQLDGTRSHHAHTHRLTTMSIVLRYVRSPILCSDSLHRYVVYIL